MILAGGFFALMGVILPIINFPVLLGIVGFIGLNVLGHVVLGRWVARRIAAIQDDIREFRRDQGGGDPEKERLWELVGRLTRAGDAASPKDEDGGKSAKD